MLLCAVSGSVWFADTFYKEDDSNDYLPVQSIVGRIVAGHFKYCTPDCCTHTVLSFHSTQQRASSRALLSLLRGDATVRERSHDIGTRWLVSGERHSLVGFVFWDGNRD